MTFAAPLFLAAALAAAIPVVLHMINQQQAKDLPFPTLRFLKISVEKTRRRKRVHDLLLMLLRVAVLMLIAFALAKPTVTTLSSLWGDGANSAVAIVLDNSASMGMVDSRQMRFDTATHAATQILDELGDGDRVALLLTSGPKFPEEGKLERTQENARQMLAQVTPSYERADLVVKLQQAQALLADIEATNKQIYVITDLQELCWEGLAEEKKEESSKQTDAEKEQDESDEIPIIFVDCNRAPKPNVAVQDIAVHAAVPVAGLPVKASVELFNAAPIEQQRHLELHIDGEKKDSSPALKIPAESTLKHDFLFKFDRGGLHRGEVRLVGEDGSALDDRRFFSMDIDQGIPVGIVKAQRHEIAYLDDTFYVQQALSPGNAGSWAISTTSLVAADLLSEPLNQYKVLICVNLSAPDADTAQRLVSYVTGGGNLIWFCGDNVDPQAYNQANEQAGGKLLPAPLLDIRAPVAGEERDSWNITSLEGKHPALRDLIEPASLYQSVLVYKHQRFDTANSPDALALARLNDGEALILQRDEGDGKVLMVGTTAHTGWSNLPLRPLFLPLLARLTFELAGGEQTRHSALAGTPIILPLDDAVGQVGVEVRPPSGEMLRLTSEAEQGTGRQVFRYPDTYHIGLYMLRLLDASRPTQLAFSVNVNPDEAVGTKIAREKLEELLKPHPLVFAEDPEDLTDTFTWLREGKSLWGTFLGFVLIVLVFETLIANRLSPKKDEENNQPPPGMRRLARKGHTAA